MQNKMGFEEEKLKKLKELTKPVDARKMMKYISENSSTMSDQERLSLQSSLADGFYKSGNTMLERAFIEKVLTEKQWIKMRDKYKFTIEDMGTILQPVFNKKDGHFGKNDKIKIATMPYSKIFKHRVFLKRRFNIDILSIEEINDMMKKGEI